MTLTEKIEEIIRENVKIDADFSFGYVDVIGQDEAAEKITLLLIEIGIDKEILNQDLEGEEIE